MRRIEQVKDILPILQEAEYQEQQLIKVQLSSKLTRQTAPLEPSHTGELMRTILIAYGWRVLQGKDAVLTLQRTPKRTKEWQERKGLVN